MGLGRTFENMFKNSIDAANPLSGKGALLKPLTAPLTAPAQGYGAVLQDTGGNPNHSFGALDPNGNLNDASRQGGLGSMSVVRGGLPQDQLSQLQNPQPAQQPLAQTPAASSPAATMVGTQPNLNQPLAQNQQQQQNVLGQALLQLLQAK